MADTGARPCKRNRAWHRAQWRKHVEAQDKGGLSAAAYCREHRLSRRSFYRWRGIFSAENVAGGVSEFVGAHKKAPKAAAFAEVRFSSPAVALTAASGVEVVLPGEQRLHVEQGFDEDTLRRVVMVLESLSC